MTIKEGPFMRIRTGGPYIQVRNVFWSFQAADAGALRGCDPESNRYPECSNGIAGASSFFLDLIYFGAEYRAYDVEACEPAEDLFTAIDDREKRLRTMPADPTVWPEVATYMGLVPADEGVCDSSNPGRFRLTMSVDAGAGHCCSAFGDLLHERASNPSLFDVYYAPLRIDVAGDLYELVEVQSYGQPAVSQLEIQFGLFRKVPT